MPLTYKSHGIYPERGNPAAPIPQLRTAVQIRECVKLSRELKIRHEPPGPIRVPADRPNVNLANLF